MRGDSQGTYREVNRRRGGSPLGWLLLACVLPIIAIIAPAAVSAAANVAPTARDDSFTATEDRSLTVRASGVLRNDSDRDRDRLSAALVSGPDHGTLTLNPNGSFDYEPEADFNGTDSFTYKANDGASDSNTATVRITVRPVNDDPVAEDDEYVIRGQALNVAAPGVLANDADIDGGRLSAARVSPRPDHGRLTLRSNGSFVYTPNASFDDTDSFTYIVRDGRGGSDRATVTIKSNNDPVADDDSYTVDEDETLNVTAPGVLDGDTDDDGDPLTAANASDPPNGTLTAFNSDGSFDYAPDDDFNGQDTFTYEARDGQGGSDEATVTITVNPLNDAPVAEDDTKSTPENTPLVFPASDLTDNDSEGAANEGSQDLTVTEVKNPVRGTVDLDDKATPDPADDEITFTPETDYNGPASFEYTVCDDGTLPLCSTQTATVNVTVSSVNSKPEANNGAETMDEDEDPITIGFAALVSDIETSDANLTYTIVNGPTPSEGTLSGSGSTRQFDSADDFNGEVEIDYTVTDRGDPDDCQNAATPPAQGCDASETSDEKTVTITVNPVNDTPNAVDDGTAYDPAATTDEDTATAPIDVLANDIGLGDAPISVTIETDGANGAATVNNDNTITYDPDDDANGPDSFVYEVCDGDTTPECDTATVYVEVASVNDAPAANDDGTANDPAATTDEDTATAPIDVLANDIGLGDTPISVTIETDGTIGAATVNNDNTITYTPDDDANGSDSFVYEVCDGNGDCDTATVAVTVSPVNDAPTVAFDNPPSNADEGETKTFAFTVTDPDPGDTFTVKNGFPDCGTGGELVDDSLDTEAPDYSFECRFADGPANPDVRIQVADSNADSNVATQSVAVANVKPSISLSGPDEADEGDTEEYTFTITDPGDDTHTITTACGDDGDKVANSDQYDAQTKEGGFECLFPDGPATTNVTATVTDSDGDADTDNQLVEVTVDNVAPTVENQSVSTDEDTEKTITLSATDPAGTNDPPTFTIESLPENGTLYEGANTGGSELTSPGEISGNEVTYKPDADYNNTADNPDTFTYKANDSDADSNTATVSITVGALNDAPTLDLDDTTDGNDSAATFNEPVNQPGPGIALAPNAEVSDVDNDNLTTATVTLTDRPDGDDESLSADTTDTDITAVYANGILSLTGDASVADYQKVLRTVEYDNTKAPPNRANRTVTFTVNDGVADSASRTSTVTVVPLNEAPVVDLNGAPDGIDTTASFTEGGGPVVLAPDTIVSDADDAELFSATITLTNRPDGNDESLSAGSSGPITVTPYNPSTGVLKFSGSNLASQYEALLRTVTYSNSSDAPNDTPRVVTFVVNDQKDDSVVATSTVSITPTNDAPTVATSNFSPSFTEGGSPTLIDDGFTVTDPDDTSLASATVQVTDGFQTGKDVLSFADQNGITGAFSGDTLTLTGPAGIADWEDALSSITFSTTSQAPDTSRTVSVKVDDGDAESAAATKTITVVPVNNAPNLAQPDGALTYTEDTPSEDHQLAIAPNLTVSDADSANIESATVEITDGYQNGEDFLSFATANGISGDFDTSSGALALTHASGTKTLAEYETALRNVKYQNTSENPSDATRTVAFAANDGGAENAESDAATRDITVVRTNDAPVNDVPADPFRGGVGSGLPITGISVSDVDAGTGNVKVTLSVSGGANNGALMLRTDVTDGLVAADITGNGSASATATAPLSKINATLSANNGLVYNNTTEGSFTLTVATDDLGNTGSGGAKTDTDTVGIVIDAPPSVMTTNPANNATDVAPGGNITINFSESVNANAASFELKCPSTGTARSLAVTGSGSNSITLNPGSDLPGATVCEVRVISTNVTDTDNNDPPDNMAADHVFTFTTAPKALADDYKDTFTVVGNVSYDSANSSPVRSVLDNDEKDGSTTVTGSATTSAQGGNVTVRPNGTFTYNPPAGYEGLDTFTYTLNGGSSATVTLRVGGMVWFVNENATTSGDGRFSSPFTSLSAFNDVNGDGGNNPAANDNIYLYESNENYAGGVTLLSGQRLIGQDTSQSVSEITSLNRPSGSPDFPTRNSGNATKTIIINASGIGVTLGAGNIIRGLTVQNTSGSGIKGTSVNAATMGADVAVSGTNGGAGVDISGGNGTVSYAGTISNTAGRPASVTGRAGGLVSFGGDISSTGSGILADNNAGTIIFSGANKTLNTGANNAVTITNNAAGTVNLTGGNLAIDTTSGIGFSASGGGTFNVTGLNNTITSSSGKAVDINGGALNMSFAGVSSTGSSTNGIALTNTTGSFVNPSGGTLSNATNADVSLSGGTTNFTYGGSITDDTGTLVSISGQTGGTKQFAGAISDGPTANNGNGISLSNNTGATIRFDGGLTLSTGGNAAFSATGDGTVVVTDPATTDNTIATTTGTALNVANTTIGSGGLNFQSISANGATNGIVLNNTGANGGLSVTGNSGTCNGSGATCTGGVIQNTTGDGVSLTNTRSPSFGFLKVIDTGRHGIFGTDVVNFTLENSTVFGAGNADDEDGVHFRTPNKPNVTGTMVVRNSLISRSTENNLGIENYSGTLNLTVDNSDFTETLNSIVGGTSGEEGIKVIANSPNATTPGATINARVHNGSTFDRLESDAISAFTNNNGTLNITVEGNTFTGHTDGDNALSIRGASTGTIRYDVKNNSITGHGNSAIFLSGEERSVVHGNVENNDIGNPAVVDSGSIRSRGIELNIDDNSDAHVRIHNNRIHHTDFEGIYVDAHDTSHADPITGQIIQGDPDADVTVTNNTIGTPDDNSQFPLFVNSIAMYSSDKAILCANIQSNAPSIGTGAFKAIGLYTSPNAGTSTFKIERLTGGTNVATSTVQSHVASENNENPAGSVEAFAQGTGPRFTGAASGSCQLPTAPTLPQ